jgi:hypothetical protein
VDLARSFKQGLKARHLLLQIDGFPRTWKVNPSCHLILRGISL